MPAYAETVTAAKPHSPPLTAPIAPISTANSKEFASPRFQENVVISGMSGKFPESNNIEEFAQNLYNGVDMVTEDDRRWTPGAYGLPKRSGKVIDLEHFDSAFFSVSPRQAHMMDPQLRILLELTHEAILDAGVNPSELRGRRVGVYIGVSSSESEEVWIADPSNVSGYALTGCCRAMFANRISYTFDFKGPSFAIDTACSSSMVAFQNAWKAITDGEIEAAIVGGSNLTLKPQNALQFNALNMLAKDGKCKSFDASGNGYVRSEAIAVIFLQRATQSRRVYAHIVHARANTDGNKGEGITFPSGAVQRELLQEVYTQSGISPSDVAYVEAHGTGTKVGDPQEVNALADVFCTGRTEPLLLGSVKSNMGHSEPASGLCSIIKVLLAMQRGQIPQNLHFSTPNPEIPALVDGRIKVVSENTPWNGGYAAINSFGFGGANVHVLLRSASPSDASTLLIPTTQRICPRLLSKEGGNEASHSSSCDALPRLILAPGRTEETLTTFLEDMKKKATPDLCGLLDRISEMPNNSYPARGFVVTDSENSVAQASRIQNTDRPVWLVFSGMGSQWTGCGKALLRLPNFAAAIRKCHAALKPFDLDLMEILTSDSPAAISSTAASFSSIAAMQVGLIELLRQVGLQDVSGMVGHSVGELGCAYADGTLTAEQTVLAAYWRGRAVQEATLPVGGMAAVGLSVAEAQKRCRDGVIVACHNAHDSVTLSGPKEVVDSILEELTAEGIFCRAVRSEGVAFHHPSLKAAAPRLLKELQKIIPKALTRSSKWVSTSVPEGKLNTAQEASAQYLVNNLLSPVLFSEALEKIPQEAILVEVSPHGLLQAVLRRAFPSSSPIALIRKDAKCTLIHFLEALGKIYINGTPVNIGALYSPTPVPVHSSTPSISSFIRWDHNQEWEVARFSTSPSGSEYEVKVDLETDAHKYLEGHTIDGRVIFPATGYMVLAWQALCRLKGLQWEDTAVTFKDVKLHQATVLSSSSSSSSANITTLIVRILLAKGEFEVVVSDSVAASGCIHLGAEEANDKSLANHMKASAISDKPLLKKDVYRELRLRGYQYKGIFQGIVRTDIEGTSGSLMWQDNWVSLLDTFLQFSLVGAKQRGLMLPTRIRKVTIDPSVFYSNISEDDIRTIPVNHNPLIGATTSHGIVFQGLKASLAPRRPTQDQPLLQALQFVPLHIRDDIAFSSEVSEQSSLGILIDLVIENSLDHTLKIVEMDANDEHAANPLDNTKALNIVSCVDMHPQLKVNYSLHTSYKFGSEDQEQLSNCGVVIKDDVNSSLSSAHLVVLHQSVDNDILEKVKEDAFILATGNIQNSLESAGYETIASIKKQDLMLLRKAIPEEHYQVLDISSQDSQFTWVTSLKEQLEHSSKLWLVSSADPTSGILGFVNCLRREPGGEKIRCLFVPGGKANLNSSITSRDLAVNVYRDDVWGTYRHTLLSPLAPKPSSHALLNVATRGDLASLTWYQAPPPEFEDEDKSSLERIVCDVHYAPLNFRDVMLATGKLPPDALPGDLATKECILGLEFSGTNNGERVMGLVAAGGLATTVKADPLLTWKVPSSWSLKDAATVPVVYATAYYALVVRGGLQEGESVLIHAGSGGVGQAAISIALARACKVFTTVSSEKKKKVLQERFPELKDENFANSRDNSFEYDVLERTGGQGVDVVLNSLAGELLQASVRCLREHGRFLEIGKADLSNNTALGMAIFLKNVTFHGILLDALFDGSPSERKRLNQLLSDGMNAGVVRPLPLTLFTRDGVEDAFRYMATGKHIGKVVLEIKPKDDMELPTQVSAVPRMSAQSSMVYVITGGMGGLGLELAGWLISRGAKKLVLTSRRGITTGYQALCIRRWTAAGINVRVLTKDASTIEGATSLLKEAANEGPIGGIFHLAVVLKDALFDNQTSESFYAVNHVKGDGAIAIDMASRTCCPDLHLWVAFSSVACGKGNAGQTNYGWANSVSERVVEERVRLGLPGVVIQWGGVGEVGVLADTLGEIEVGGTKPQSIRSVLGCLDVLLLNSSPIVSSVCLATKAKKSDGGKGGSLVKSVANILGVKDVSKVPLEITLGDLGLDSLMSVEVKQTLEREADLVLTAAQVRELTLKMLQDMENSSGSPANNNPETASGKSSELNEQMHGAPVPWLTLPLIPEECVCVLKKEGSGIPLFLTAPIHGSTSPLMEMSQDLNRPVYGFQYPSSVPHTSIPELATYLVEKLLEIHPSGEFILGGYSFGTSVTLEMTRILEVKSRSPSSVVLLDGSQSYVSGIIDHYKARHISSADKNGLQRPKPEIQEQVEMLLVFAMQFITMDALALKKTLSGMTSWEERVNHIAKLVTQSRNAAGVKTSSNEQQQAVDAAELLYRRLIMADKHVPDYSLKTPTMLIRAKDNPQAPILGHDYGLSKVMVGPLKIEEVRGSHETFLAGENGKQVALLISSFMNESS